jgi:hypothetical protein
MSRLQIKAPPKVLLAGVVFTVLAVVIVINLVVWLGGSTSSGTVDIDLGSEELTPPGDLDQVTRDVTAYQKGESPPLLAASTSGERGRDPFVFASNRKRTRAAKPTSDSQPKRGNPIRCTAIFVGGGTHSALVAGRVVAEGDRVKNYLVGKITDKGVTLIAGGRKKFLPLETKRTGGAVGAPVALGR